MFNLCVFPRALQVSNFIYTVLNAGIPVIYVVVSAVIIVMCVIRHSDILAVL